ncbi:MAG: hypothetical protein AABW45_03600 [Nanoarchaeota archaeon]
MKIGKKGAELSINVIIIAILVILVLVVVAAFFTGSSSKLFGAIRDIFRTSTAGSTLQLAEQNCQSYCEQAKDLQNPSKSAYCNSFFNIDINNDGEAEYTREGNDKIYKKYYCGQNPEGESLNIPCSNKQGNPLLC